ncbi:MAG: 2-hydroxyacid dehydrogenase [Asticcacaulis sp.]
MSRPKILVTRPWPQAVEERLKGQYDVTVLPEGAPLVRGGLIAAMCDYDALCVTVADKLDAEVLGTPQARVRMIGNFGVGFEHIDVRAAAAAGIRVSNTPDVLTDATADLALMLMLMASRRAGEGERQLRAGQWDGWGTTHMLGQSLQGKRLGLIGFGRIGQATAQRAHAALGMTIAYHSRRRAAPEIESRMGAQFVEDLSELIASADVLSLHCPGGPETRHLIDAARLGTMKPTAILINTARGAVVNEADLARALTNGAIAAAGLDVYEHEPKVHPDLLRLENAVLLPHLGSATIETRNAMGFRVCANLDRFFAGEPLLDPIA